MVPTKTPLSKWTFHQYHLGELSVPKKGILEESSKLQLIVTIIIFE